MWLPQIGLLTTSQRSVWSPFPVWTWRNSSQDTQVQSYTAGGWVEFQAYHLGGFGRPWSCFNNNFFCEAFCWSYDLIYFPMMMLSWSYLEDIEWLLITSGRTNRLGREDSLDQAPWEGAICPASMLQNAALGRISIYAQRGTERKFSSASKCLVTQIDEKPCWIGSSLCERHIWLSYAEL